jgi:hypothetical protein
MEAVLTTDSLSPNITVEWATGTPRYRKVHLRSMICSEEVLAATYSDPNVAVSTVDCSLVEKITVWLAQCKVPVTDFH